MAGKGYATVQLLEDQDDESDDELIVPPTTSKPAADNLLFQDFGHPIPLEDDNVATLTKTSLLSSNMQDSDDDEDDKRELLSEDKKAPSFWSFEYYQSFFDVDTKQVLGRMLHSMVPSKQNYLLTKIRPNPDLYGPFWICATLVFTIAICGNLSSYFASEGNHKWKSDFQLVSLSACVIFSYAWLTPTSLWGYLLWRGNQAGFSYLEIVCVYGYSLAIFIPISLLWVIPFDSLRWILVVVGVCASGSVLALTFWSAVEDDSKKAAIISMVCIIMFHAALAVGFKLYFFKSIHIHKILPPSISTNITSRTSVQHS